MQKDSKEESADRRKQGYPGLEVIGWAAPPRYDHASHRLYWAKELHFDNDQNDNTLNYDIRILGRRGLLALNAIARRSQMTSVETGMQQILDSVEFNQGHRYVDYLPSSDKLAKYGIAALVAGKVAAKIGLLKWLIGILLGAKKLAILAFAAIAGFFRKRFRRKSEQAKRQQAAEQYALDLEQRASHEKPDGTA
jgi:uncharacterized membrane-anchored protein